GSNMMGLELGMYIKANKDKIGVIIICDKQDEPLKEKVYLSNMDECLVKPFGSRELVLKVQRVLMSQQVANTKDKRNILRLRYIEYDLDKRVVVCNGERLTLRRKEMKLLEYFLRNQGKVVTRDELLTNVWGAEINSSTNTVEVHLKRLRDKIEKPYGEKFLYTIHGIGYLAE
ncbi:MAG: response regulator transcription factor, partial [Romboutsia sp.]|nr:response regulator transcription factor [Romboutsia sp.]